MTSINVFSLAVVLMSSALSVWHVRTWETIKAAQPASGELKFAWRQMCRRIKASALLALVGVAAFVSQFLDPLLRSGIWAVIVLLVFWMVLLAVLDMMAIRQHFAQQHSGQVAEHAKLRTEIEQMREEWAKRRLKIKDHDGG